MDHEVLGRWELPGNLRQELDELDWSRMHGGHRHAPSVAFFEVASGNTIGGLSLVGQLIARQREGDRPLDSEDAAEIAILRLWSGLVEHRHDQEAIRDAMLLLANTPAPDSARRALLHLNLAATLQEHLLRVDLAEMDLIEHHLSSARHLAQLLGLPRMEVAALSRLALMDMLRGRVPAALHHTAAVRALIAAGGTDFGHSWRHRIVPVEQWARHAHNLPTDVEALQSLMRELESNRRSVIVCAMTASATALALIDQGRLEETRRMLERVLDEPIAREAGPWLLVLAILDGYLAINSQDDRRLVSALRRLRDFGGLAEANLLEATVLVQQAEHPRALELLEQVTSGELPALSLTYPSACVLHAVVLHRVGQVQEASHLLAQALADTQRTSALRPFTIHDPHVIRPLLSSVDTDTPALRSWLDKVRTAVDATLTSHVNGRTSVPLPTGQGSGRKPSPLTPREAEVLALAAAGTDQAAIARNLYLSVNTVKTHLRAVRRKLDVDRTSDAVTIASREGWVD